MSRHRFFLVGPLPAALDGGAVTLPLSDADLHHAVDVLRVRDGEQIDVVEPGGGVWRVQVASAGADALVTTVLERLPAATGPRAHVTLVFGVSKGSKNDDMIEGAIEVGVDEVLPVLAARSIVKYDADKRAERGQRWRRVAMAASKQSKRTALPIVADPTTLPDTLATLAGYDLVLVAWEERDASGRGVRAAIAQARAAGRLAAPAVERSGVTDAPRAAACGSPLVAIVVGPEGGLAAEEVAALEGIGALPVTLGSTILRAETAAVVAAALVIHELGGLGNAL